MMIRRFLRTAIVVAATILATSATAGAAQASHRDRIPPTAPYIVYSQGFYCMTFYIGVQRSTDNVTPQLALRYEVYTNGYLLATYADNGYNSAAWATLRLRTVGPQMVYVRAIDAAGNRSAPTRSNPITGYPC
jgi:hypothetical protein